MDGELKKEIKDTFFTNSDFIYIYIYLMSLFLTVGAKHSEENFIWRSKL